VAASAITSRPGILRSPALRRLVGAPLLRLALLGARPRPDGPHVLLAPPGDGNIGDQALVEAFLENVAGPVVVLVRRPGDIAIPREFAATVRLLPLPALVYGRVTGHARDVLRAARVLRGAASVSVVGADVMDGAYVPGASEMRSRLVREAARRGIPSRILGFSWNSAPRPSATAALRSAVAAGAIAVARDPVSAERLRAIGVDARLGADIVFRARTVSDALAVETGSADPRPLAVINASGLIRGWSEQVDEYVDLVRRLGAEGTRTVILPHVLRADVDDLVTCRAIHARVGDDAVLVERLASPAEVRGLARTARVVVTGRMHLAVMAAMSGVPAFTIATQGKVEGLMAALDCPELCLEPGPGLADRVLAADLDELGGRLRRALPTVVARAESNFESFPRPAGATLGAASVEKV